MQNAASPSLPRTILLNYWRTSRLMLLTIAICVFLSSIASVAAPYLFSRLIDQLNSDRLAETLVTGFVVYVLLLGLSSALQTMLQYLSLISAESLAVIAGTSMFERLLRKTADFFVEHNPAEIESARKRGENALMTLVQLGLIVFIPGATQIILTLVLLGATINLELVAVVLVYGTCFVALTSFANHRSQPFLDRAIEGGQENARFVGNSINAMETLRHFGAHQWMLSRFSDKAREVFDNWRAFCLQKIGFSAIQGLALTVQFLVTFLMLLPRLREGALSVGDVVLFNALLLQLNQPFEMIGHALDDVVRATASLKPLIKLWDAPDEAEAETAVSFSINTGTVQFENVGYHYVNGRGVSNVSFTARRGHISYLTGETGSGKSTAFRLALKSLEPQTGRITIDGTPLHDVDRREWYGHIGIVPQELMLLNDTLATNITLGRPLDQERLRLAAGRAAILDFIDALPDGFETSVGERGLKLSGGERQRIAIARAFYNDPAILFLDEASSSLDAATERDIMEHIRAVCDTVTVIAITHRTAMIMPGDHVVRIDGETLDEDRMDATA
ncbi:ABC transporter ATP-binding protein [Rhizobium sp. PL01]|uniref:ABC transporter ATP-binding protein n=1 Tax=Rhizobium sp. PL01 TaxID=3085631 RepID=UPI002980F14F|nr:ABC transporter ATP-binding protein [Rhizobium sp. PL01]MDW5314424.1 ABC transporter ATP-binding protein [Rhizobium sp. PL01]